MMLLYRTILLLVGGGALIVGIILVFVLILSWTNNERLQPLAEHLGYTAELEQVYLSLAPGTPTDRAAATLRELARSPAALVPETPAALGLAADRLEVPVAGAAAAREALATALARERAAHRARLEELRAHNLREFQAALALAVVLPAFSIAMFVFFHRRVLTPLNDLSHFLGLLARKDYAVVTPGNVDPLVRPLFEKYNRMVKRMHDLEQGHVKREDSLRNEVGQATRALFQQQAAMARVERLAAVGEVSARLGHELRNPLSGVLMALTNLRSEIESDDQERRLALAIAELERIAHLLTRIVDESRQIPERPRRLELRRAAEELASLARYQLGDEIELEVDVPEELHCTVPETGLRHALLNLVLNAAQALEGRPGTVCIFAERRPDGVAICVSDNGPGFPEELLGAGVHEFGSWRHGGTGLGLATVRRFAFANAGRLQLANLPEGGACATLLLPFEEAA